MRKRQTIRLRDFDYTSNGPYFITICTYKRECILGEIVNGKMNVNLSGKIVRDELLFSVDKRPHIRLDEFIIMPNHVHAIILILSEVGAMRCIARNRIDRKNTKYGQSTGLPLQMKRGSQPKSLNEFVGNFKSFTTKRINKMFKTPGSPFWQRNYYERIIRNKEELEKLRFYIRYNPSKWMKDEENPINWHKYKLS